MSNPELQQIVFDSLLSFKPLLILFCLFAIAIIILLYLNNKNKYICPKCHKEMERWNVKSLNWDKPYVYACKKCKEIYYKPLETKDT